MATSPFICVIDDAADYRFLLQQVFKRYFPAYQVQFFAGGHALLEKLPGMDRYPSLILLDRHMPDLDGHQTLLRLKQHTAYKKIPVVMMSADASAYEINGCYEAYANSFLVKRMDLVSLKEIVSAICHYWLELNREPVEV